MTNVKKEDLPNIAIIKEEGGSFVPKEPGIYYGDGFYWKYFNDTYFWFKVSNGTRADVFLKDGGTTIQIDSYTNLFWSIMAYLNGSDYIVDWQPNTPKTRHNTANPFDPRDNKKPEK